VRLLTRQSSLSRADVLGPCGHRAGSAHAGRCRPPSPHAPVPTLTRPRERHRDTAPSGFTDTDLPPRAARLRPDRAGGVVRKAGPANQLGLTAVLRRAFGTSSPGVAVVFSAADTTPERKPRGQFTTPAPSDHKGMTTVKFSPLDTLYKGRLTVYASTQTPTPVQDSVVIYIVP
jgi:hypothetical protein